MSYTIGHVVYGIDLSEGTLGGEAIAAYGRSHEDMEGYLSWCFDGSYYAVFGVELGTIDETEVVVMDDLLKMCTGNALMEAVDNFLFLWQQAPEEFRNVIKDAKPKVMIMWSTS